MTSAAEQERELAQHGGLGRSTVAGHDAVDERACAHCGKIARLVVEGDLHLFEALAGRSNREPRGEQRSIGISPASLSICGPVEAM